MNWEFMGQRDGQGKFQMSPAMLQFMAQMGSNFGQGQSAGQAIGDATSQALRMQTLGQGGGQYPQPTPVGTPGPNAVKENIVRTADGIKRTVTVDEPNETAPSYNQTPEATTPQAPTSQPIAQGAGGVSDPSPFFRALLSRRG